MSGGSLWWLDWRLRGGATARAAGGRFLLLLLLAVLFLCLVLSGGVNRLLSQQWTLTAVLRLSVPAVEGEGIAASVRRLPAVGSAVYKDPEAAWKEFIAAYPGLESLRQAGGNPLPGFVEVRLRPDRLTEADIAYVASTLRPLAQVERLLAGGEGLSTFLRVKRLANAVLWTVFALLCAVYLAVLGGQERSSSAALLPDLAFLAERGVPLRSVVARRAAGSALSAGILATLAAAAAAAALYALAARYPQARLAIAGPAEIGSGSWLPAVAAFVLLASLAAAGASVLGWRAARSAAR